MAEGIVSALIGLTVVELRFEAPPASPGDQLKRRNC